MAQEYRLISSNGHLEVLPERWTPRVPRKYQDRVPQCASLFQSQSSIVEFKYIWGRQNL